MASCVTIFKEDAVVQLRKLPKISVYSNPEHPAWADIIQQESITKETDLQMHCDGLASKVISPADADNDSKRRTDVQNTLAVYECLGSMTPKEATDERIWVYLCHNDLWEYTGNRWPLPADPNKWQKHVLTHYFAPSARSLVKDNAISRLWWQGYIASRYVSYTNGAVSLEESLEILTSATDVRAALLERPARAASPEIFNGVMSFLDSCFCRKTKTFSFHRDDFRALMKQLNREGGSKMLNILGPEHICEFLTTRMPRNGKSNAAT